MGNSKTASKTQELLKNSSRNTRTVPRTEINASYKELPIETS